MRVAGISRSVAALVLVSAPIALVGACSSDNSLPNAGASTSNGGSGSSSGAMGDVTASSGGVGSGSSSGTGMGSGGGMGAGIGSSSGGGTASSSGAGTSSGTSSSGANTTSSSGGPASGSSSSGAAASGSSSGGSGVKSDAGMTGGGSGGGGDAGAGGPSLCPVAGTTICDGFEGAAPGAAGSDFTISVTGADTMAVDATKAYRGAKSMHFAGTTQAYIVESKTFMAAGTKATNNASWGRYFVWLVPSDAAGPQAHYVFGTMVGTNAVNANGDQFHFVGGTRDTIQTQIRIASDLYTGGGTTPAATDPKVPTAASGWQCWEWQIQPDDSFQFYINGQVIPEMALTAGKTAAGGAFPLPTVTSLQLGWQSFTPYMLSGWIDEVALGPSRIGCGN